VFLKITSFKNLLTAYRKTRKRKRFRRKLQKFELNLEDRLIDVQKKLKTGSYRPKQYHQFLVYEPKLRQVSAPAFIDRVVHHAIINIIEPLFDRQFISNTFACRKKKGTHACMLQTAKCYQRLIKKCPILYVLKCDIKSYFASINHFILIKFLTQTITCPKTLNLLKTIINSYEDILDCGIPIGNLTSQLFANIYLHPLDLYVTKTINEKNYCRYMDDFIILSRNKDYLICLRKKIQKFLHRNLNLQLHPRKANIFRGDRGLDFVGYFIKPDNITLRKKTLRHYKKRHKKRLKQLQNYKKQLREIQMTSQLPLFKKHHQAFGSTHRSTPTGVDIRSIVGADPCVRPQSDPCAALLEEKIQALKTKLRASRNSFKGFLQYSEYKKLKSGGVNVSGIIIPKIFPKK